MMIALSTGEDDDFAAFLGVSLRTLARYKRHPDKMPLACKRLLRLRISGDLRALGGDEWEHFYIKRGLLYLPEYRNGFTAHHIRAMFFEVQQVKALQNELKALKRELWASKKVREAERNGSRGDCLRPFDDARCGHGFGNFERLYIRHHGYYADDAHA